MKKSLDAAKNQILGPMGTPRRDQYEKELEDELYKNTKIKAKRLVDAYLMWIMAVLNGEDQIVYKDKCLHIAKECARMGVNNIEDTLMDFALKTNQLQHLDLVFWEKVKEEISHYKGNNP